MRSNLCGDIIFIILSYVPICKYKNLHPIFTDDLIEYCTQKELENLAICHFKNNKSLDAFFNKKSGFLLALQQSKAVISGSTILKMILHDDWTANDLDIYVISGNEGPLEKWIKTKYEKGQWVHSYIWHGGDKQQIYNNHQARCTFSLGYSQFDWNAVFSHNFPKIARVDTYQICDKSVQIIQINRGLENSHTRLMKYIEIRFDYSCLKNCFDGQNLWVSNIKDVIFKEFDIAIQNDSFQKLYIKTLDSERSKSWNQVLIAHRKNRFKKYIERGFRKKVQEFQLQE